VTELPPLVAVSAALVFVFVVLIEGALRPGYDPTYHTGSELELGTRGWVQRVNFLLMGAGSLAFAVGVLPDLGHHCGCCAARDLRTRPNRCRGFRTGRCSGLSTRGSIRALNQADLARLGPRSYWRARRVPSDLRSLPHDRPAPSRRLATVHAAYSSCWSRFDHLDGSRVPKRCREDRTRAARTHSYLLDLDRGAGHPPHRRSALTLADGYSIRGRRYEFPYWLKKASLRSAGILRLRGVLAALRGRSTSVRQQDHANL
jgi:hypothetical protein